MRMRHKSTPLQKVKSSNVSEERMREMGTKAKEKASYAKCYSFFGCPMRIGICITPKEGSLPKSK